jgi:hypothetical protein
MRSAALRFIATQSKRFRFVFIANDLQRRMNHDPREPFKAFTALNRGILL